MGLESGTFVNDLVTTNPPGTDSKSQGDDHLRLIKTVLRNTFLRATRAWSFPGAVAKTSNYTVLSTDNNLMITVDTTAAAVTLTLPTLTASDDGWRIDVVKINTGVNPVFIASVATVNGFSQIRRSINFLPTRVVWTGAAWVATRPNGGAPVGSAIEYYGATLPNGHLWADGSTFTAANFVELNAALGTNVTPDRRGRAAFGRDDLGGTNSNRIGSIAGITGTTLKSAGGEASHILSVGELATHNHTITDPQHSHGLTDTGHNHTQNAHTHTINGGSPVAAVSGPGGLNVPAGATTFGSAALSIDATTATNNAAVTGITMLNSPTNISLANSGSSSAHNTMPPTLICNVIVVAE